jgi:hypothetical protein
MFKTLAQLGAGRRYMVPEAAPTYCIYNHPDRRLAAASRRARPQGLTCHWRAAAAGGRVECNWQIEPADETSAEAPGPSCATRQMHGLLVRGLLGFAWRGRPAIRAA